MKHNTIHIILLAILTLSVASCKQDNWLDWKAQNELWMQQHAQQADILTTASGLQYQVIYAGNPTDSKIGAATTVICDYEGKLITGKTFDKANGAQLQVSQVVAGFAEGLKKMNVGGDYVLYIPWDLGYGKDGTEADEKSSAFIPPYSTLIFTVHISSAYTN